jgi:dTDP-4-dehydrorhamnose 3,5-epimerase
MDKYEFEILGAFAFSVENNLDERGSLIRIFDSVDLFPNFKVVQASYVENPIDGTLRGLHFQAQEHAENKIVQCVSGKIYDVIVDIDKESRTYGKVCSVQLGPKEKFQGIFIPKNCAHGYLTLSENSNLTYFMDIEYSPKYAKGIKWNDPLLGIEWPKNVVKMSSKDSNLPYLQHE